MAIAIAMVLLGAGAGLDLSGTWEYSKLDAAADQPPASGWTATQVPGRIDLAPLGQIWYRKRFTLAGVDFRRATLRLHGAKFAPLVRVNGREAGRSYDGFVRSDFDVTPSLSPGENLIEIACRGIASMTDGTVDFTQGETRDLLNRKCLGLIGSQWSRCGLWDGVELVLTGDLAISDVFVKTSVREHRIDVDVAIRNQAGVRIRAALEAEVEPIGAPPFIRADVNGDGILDLADPIASLDHLFAGRAIPCADAADANDDGSLDIADAIHSLQYLFADGPEPPAPFPGRGADPTSDGLGCGGSLPSFAPIDLDLAPGEEVRRTLSAPWLDPVLWSPETPFLYRLRVRAGEESAEVRFGFREFWCDGPHFVLNGVRRRLLASSAHPYAFGGDAARREIALYKDLGFIAFRFHAQPWERVWYDTADEMGLLIVHESALWCGYYRWDDERFWRNAAEHVRANVLANRNHPSIVIWSVENEALLTGGASVAGTAERLAALGAGVRTLDPTRPIMFEGDEDPAGSADVINLHYPQEPPGARTWPEVAWWLERSTRLHTYPRVEWSWSREKPLYIGEFLWLSPTNPHTATIFEGDAAYANPGAAREATKAATWEMAIRAYRGCDVSGMCPWNAIENPGLPREANRRGYARIACFAREVETRFFGGARIPRRLYVHNDAAEPFAGSAEWELRVRADVRQGEAPVSLGPAESAEVRVEIPLPEVADETAATFAIIVRRGAEEVFRDEVAWSIAPLRPIPAPAGIGLFDPAGTLDAALAREGIAARRVSDLRQIPPDIRFLLIGDGAFAAAGEPVFAPNGPGGRIEAFVRAGGQALVLRQTDLSAILPLALSDRSSTIAFARTPDHPALAGLRDGDLRFWHPGHLVAEREIMKAAGSAALPIIDSGSSNGLTSSSLLELPMGRGRYLVSQLVLTAKLRTAPQARTIFANLLGSLATWEAREESAAAVAAAGTPYGDFIARLAPHVESIALPADLSRFSFLIVDASQPIAAEALPSIDAMLAAGGMLLLHGLMPESHSSYEPLLPRLRLASNTSAPLLAGPSPFTRGMTNYAVQWFDRPESNRRPDTLATIAPFVIERTFDVANPRSFEFERLSTLPAGTTRRADGVWLYANATLRFEISIAAAGPHVICLDGYGTPLDGIFPMASIAIDGIGIGAVTFGAERECHALEIDFDAGIRAVSISFVNDAYAPPQDRNLFLDSFWYGADPDPGRCRSLLRPKALASCARGAGTILIDQVTVESSTGENARAASQYATLLLRNLGVAFENDRYGLAIPSDGFAPRGVGAFARSDGIAHLNSNGEIYCPVLWQETADTRVTIHAGGSALDGVLPHVQLKIDGQVRGAFDLAQTGIAPYALGPIRIAAGTHEIALAFTNDAYQPPQDRNLRVEKVVIQLAQ